MICIDTRFNNKTIVILKNMLGEVMLKYKCDPFVYSTSVHGIAGIIFENNSFAFTNTIEVADYYGSTEDVAIFRLESLPESEICSKIQNQEMIEIPVNNQIQEINVINEHQELFESNQKTYDVWLTRGVIFKFFDGLELSFEKNVWFSEDITIEKGHELIKRFSPVNEFLENWEGKFHGECTRETIILKNI